LISVEIMKWVMSSNQKAKIPLILGALLLLLLANNHWQHNNVQSLEKSFSSMHDDRLVPATYVFMLTDHLYKKRLLWGDAERPGQGEALRVELRKHDEAMKSLLQRFEATYLVDAESRALKDLKASLSAGQRLEERWASGASKELRAAMTAEFDQALRQLNLLSQIQTYVGADLTRDSKSLLGGANISCNAEMSLLLLVVLMLFGLVSASKSLDAPKPPRRFDPRLH
jgi:hypothetical protein